MVAKHFILLLRSLNPSSELQVQLRSVAVIKEHLPTVEQLSTLNEKNEVLLQSLLKVPEDLRKSVLDAFLAALSVTGQDHVANVFRDESADKVPMSDEHYRLLNSNLLCQFLEPRDGLVDHLFFIQVFTSSDKESAVNSQLSVNEMARQTVEIIKRKADDSFQKFVDALKETKQDHVVYILTGTGRQPMSEDHRRLLQTKKNQLVKFLDPKSGVLSELVATETISGDDEARITNVRKENDMIVELVNTLMRKSDNSFQKLINALKESKQDHVVFILTGTGRQPMSEDHRNLLQTKKNQLVKFLDPLNGVLLELVAAETINGDDEARITNVRKESDMIVELVNTLMRKSDDSFEALIKALNATEQDHVTYILTGEGDSRPLSEERRAKLVQKRSTVVSSISADCLMSTLRSNGVFSEYDQDRVKIQQTSNDKAEMMLDLIAKKSQAAFESFILALQQCHHEHVAEELVGPEVVAKIETEAKASAELIKRECVDSDLRDDMRNACETNNTEVKQLNEVLASNGISVSKVEDGSIIVKFQCRDHAALASLQELYRSRRLEQLFNEAFRPQLADKGLESLSLSITDEELQRHIRLKLMTSEHRESLLSSAKLLVNQMTISDDLLDKLSLCNRRRQAIERAATREQQVKTLLDIVSRQPDYAFTQLLDALYVTNQHIAADIISGGYMGETISKPSKFSDTVADLIWQEVVKSDKVLLDSTDKPTREYLSVKSQLCDVVKSFIEYLKPWLLTSLRPPTDEELEQLHSSAFETELLTLLTSPLRYSGIFILINLVRYPMSETFETRALQS